MRVLALDCGKSTGWAYTDGVHADSSSQRFAGCDDVGHLTHEFTCWLSRLLEGYRPDVLAMERAFGRASFTSDLPLILIGVAHGLAHARGIRRVEFTASNLKKQLTGSGKADKKDVIAAVRALGWTPDSDHAADAAACAVATVRMLQAELETGRAITAA